MSSFNISIVLFTTFNIKPPGTFTFIFIILLSPRSINLHYKVKKIDLNFMATKERRYHSYVDERVIAVYSLCGKCNILLE